MDVHLAGFQHGFFEFFELFEFFEFTLRPQAQQIIENQWFEQLSKGQLLLCLSAKTCIPLFVHTPPPLHLC